MKKIEIHILIPLALKNKVAKAGKEIENNSELLDILCNKDSSLSPIVTIARGCKNYFLRDGVENGLQKTMLEPKIDKMIEITTQTNQTAISCKETLDNLIFNYNNNMRIIIKKLEKLESLKHNVELSSSSEGDQLRLLGEFK